MEINTTALCDLVHDRWYSLCALCYAEYISCFFYNVFNYFSSFCFLSCIIQNSNGKDTHSYCTSYMNYKSLQFFSFNFLSVFLHFYIVLIHKEFVIIMMNLVTFISVFYCNCALYHYKIQIFSNILVFYYYICYYFMSLKILCPLKKMLTVVLC